MGCLGGLPVRIAGCWRWFPDSWQGQASQADTGAVIETLLLLSSDRRATCSLRCARRGWYHPMQAGRSCATPAEDAPTRACQVGAAQLLTWGAAVAMPHQTLEVPLHSALTSPTRYLAHQPSTLPRPAPFYFSSMQPWARRQPCCCARRLSPSSTLPAPPPLPPLSCSPGPGGGAAAALGGAPRPAHARPLC